MLKTYITDTRLHTIDQNWVKSTVRLLANRPALKRTGEKMGITTVVNLIDQIRMVLNFSDQNELWKPPPRFEKLMKVNRRKLMSNTEIAKSGEWELPTVGDLIKVYRVCNLSMRGWILLGLNCAFGPGELASLVISEIIAGHPKIIRRVRRKTGVREAWQLWPETSALLAKITAGLKSSDYVFHRPGTTKPLQHYSANAKFCCIGWAWPIVCKRAGVKFPIKMLRKFSAQAIRDSHGKEISELMLAHACHDISAHYTVENPIRLFEAIQVFRVTLQPLFDAIADCEDHPGPAVGYNGYGNVGTEVAA